MEFLIRNQLTTKFIGKRIIHYATVTSTMEVAKELARQGAEEGTVVIADEQISGRGRLGRTWLSPKGSLTLSIVFRPSLRLLSQLLMLTSVAVVHVIGQFCGLKAAIKWPNDILIRGKKVCGILIESEVEGEIINFAIVGIGMNVNLTTASFPEISTLATSLSQELGREISLPSFTAALLIEIERLYLLAQAGIPIHKEWQEHLETLGKWVRVKVGEVVKEGKAKPTTEEGALLLHHSNGTITTITVGDVTVLKD